MKEKKEAMCFSCCIKFQTRMNTEKRSFLSLDEEKKTLPVANPEVEKKRPFFTPGKK